MRENHACTFAELGERHLGLLGVHQRRREREIGERQRAADDVLLALEALVQHGAEAAEVAERLLDLARVGVADAHHPLEELLEGDRAERAARSATHPRTASA